jgi:hypothetical protein
MEVIYSSETSGFFSYTWHYNTKNRETSSSTCMCLIQCGLLVLKWIQHLCYQTIFWRPSEKASLSSGGPQFPFWETMEYITSRRAGDRFAKGDKIYRMQIIFIRKHRSTCYVLYNSLRLQNLTGFKKSTSAREIAITYTPSEALAKFALSPRVVVSVNLQSIVSPPPTHRSQSNL